MEERHSWGTRLTYHSVKQIDVSKVNGDDDDVKTKRK